MKNNHQHIIFIGFLLILISTYGSVFAYFPSPPDWRDLTFYEIMVDRFSDGDSTNNNVNGNYNDSSNWSVPHGGDLKGITNKLDYIKQLGVNALWITPVTTNAGDYHGYGAVHWQQVDPRLGTMSDLSTLVAQAHARGIYVFLDIVTNHMGGGRISGNNVSFSSQYPTPRTLSWVNTNSRYTALAPYDTVFTNVSSFHNYGYIDNWSDPTNYSYGWFNNSMPDVKTEDTTVQNALINVYQWWIQQADIDGYRIDTFHHVGFDFWNRWCPAIYSFASTLGKNNFLMYGEDWSGDNAVGKYTGTKNGGPYLMKSMLYFNMEYAINNVFVSGQNTKQIDDVYGNLSNYDTTAQEYLATFIDNHDMARFLAPSKANKDYNKLKLALTFLLTSRGLPIIYYGTEQGFYGETDPYCREDMWASPLKDTNFANQNSFNTNFSLYQFTSTILYLRNNYAPLRRGTYTSRWNNSSSAGLYAFSRIYNSQELIVVLNTASSVQTTKSGSNGMNTGFPQNTILTDLLDSTYSVTVGNNAGGTTRISVVVPAKSMRILSSYSSTTVPPTISSSTPTTNQINVPLNSQITLNFSIPMNQTSVQTSFSIVPSVNGVFSWNGQTLTFTPNTSLPGGQFYTVTMATTAYSSDTIPLQQPYVFSFTSLVCSGNTPPIISILSPISGSTVLGTYKPTIQATLAASSSGINSNSISMLIDNSAVSPTYDSSSGLLSYIPSVSLSTGLHQVIIDVQDNCSNSAVEATTQFYIPLQKIMDGNFSSGEWSNSELRGSNSADPWAANNIVQLYVSADTQYLYVAVVGTVDVSGNNVIGVYVDVPTITTNTTQKDYFQGMKATGWDPDFMYAVVGMQSDPNNGGGSVRKINTNGTTTEIGNMSTGDCGALSPNYDDNGLGCIEFRIPWSATNGATKNSTIKVGAWMGWANNKSTPSSGLGGGSGDELLVNTDSNNLNNENYWVGTPSTVVPVELSKFDSE